MTSEKTFKLQKQQRKSILHASLNQSLHDAYIIYIFKACGVVLGFQAHMMKELRIL